MMQHVPTRARGALCRQSAVHRLVRHARCAASSPSAGTREIDVGQCLTYALATAGQSAILAGVTYGLDQAMHSGVVPSEGNVGLGVVWLFFAFMSLRSRAFGFLDSSRPRLDDKATKGFNDRKLPSWCPPKIAFPIVWTSIAVLRATSATMIWQASDEHLFVLPLLAFLVHLSIGDTWNYINNAQAKKGVAMVFNLAFVWTSAAAVTALYFDVSPTAGYTLLPMNVWLTIAGALVFSIWDLNGREELLPYKSTPPSA